jgi:hypothetical protein
MAWDLWRVGKASHLAQALVPGMHRPVDGLRCRLLPTHVPPYPGSPAREAIGGLVVRERGLVSQCVAPAQHRG